MPHDIFISYSSHDKSVADAVCAAIESQRIRCWVAPRDVLAGTEYGAAILKAIEDCRAMVLVFSAHANEAPHVRREVERAVSKGKIIVPFRIEDVLPSGAMEYCLGNTHWLDALTPPLEKRIGELVDSVGRLLDRGPVETLPFRTVDTPLRDDNRATKKISPRLRDARRAERNKTLERALKDHDGVADCWVMQLEDHTDKGYLVSVRFDGSRLSAAGVLSLIRETFDRCLPGVPIWGEPKTETADMVSFAYTYLDDNSFLSSASPRPSPASGHETDGQRFTQSFAERPDVISAVEAVAARAPATTIAEFEKLLLRLEVCVRPPYSRDFSPEGEQHLERILRLIEEHDREDDAAKAFVSASRQTGVSYDEWSTRLEQYQRAIGGVAVVRDAMAAMGATVVPLVCVAFRRMNSCEGHNALAAGFNYAGWIESELLQVMSRLKDFRALPFIADAALREAEHMSGQNDFALAIVRAVRAFGVDRDTVDQCLQKLVGVTGTEILKERRDKDRS